MEKIIEYEKLKRRLDNFKNQKENLKDDENHQICEVDYLNACIRETKRRIKRLEELE